MIKAFEELQRNLIFLFKIVAITVVSSMKQFYYCHSTTVLLNYAELLPLSLHQI